VFSSLPLIEKLFEGQQRRHDPPREEFARALEAQAPPVGVASTPEAEEARNREPALADEEGRRKRSRDGSRRAKGSRDEERESEKEDPDDEHRLDVVA
jgi:hypothetical protein